MHEETIRALANSMESLGGYVQNNTAKMLHFERKLDAIAANVKRWSDCQRPAIPSQEPASQLPLGELIDLVASRLKGDYPKRDLAIAVSLNSAGEIRIAYETPGDFCYGVSGVHVLSRLAVLGAPDTPSTSPQAG